MNHTTKLLLEYVGYETMLSANTQAQRLVRLTVNDVLGVLQRTLEPCDYNQVRDALQQRYDL